MLIEQWTPEGSYSLHARDKRLGRTAVGTSMTRAGEDTKFTPMHLRPAYQFFALLFLSITLSAASCQRDDDEPTVNPTIDFSTDAGYTSASDTFPMSDTLLVGVRINKGDDGLNTFKVLSKYDADDEAVQDSLSIGTSTFSFDKTIITRSVAGTEKWTFWVQETDGDIIKRSLTFTVQ